MTADNYTHINLSYLYEIADGESTFIAEMLNDYQVKVPPQMDQLSVAVMQSDFPSIRFIAHKMKSSMQFLGADALVQALADIETAAVNQEMDPIAPALDKLQTTMPLVLIELQHKLAHLN